MKKFEQVSSDHHQMSMWGGWVLGLMSRVEGGGAVQCSVGNGHMRTHSELFCYNNFVVTDRHTPVLTLPSHNFVGGR